MTVTATDKGGLTTNETFTITVGDVNEKPFDLELSATNVAENAAGAVIGNLSVTDVDVDDSHTYQVSDERFEVVDGQLKLKDGESLNHETESSVDVTVTATDKGGLTTDQVFTITVGDVNEKPFDLELSGSSVDENQAGAVIGNLSVKDVDTNDSHTYQVSDERFEVVDGQLKLKDGESLDHETEASVDVTVTATDKGGLTTDQILDAAQQEAIETVYLLGADELDTSKLKNAFVIYQGSHGDNGAHVADVILPGAAYTEKSGLYTNMEGRVQMSDRAVSPKGDAKEDWAILRALSAKLNRVLPYDSLDAVREKLMADHPAFMSLDTAPERAVFDPTTLGEKGDVSSDALKNPIEDFYMTNPIARASNVMAECSAVVAGLQPKLNEAAE